MSFREGPFPRSISSLISQREAQRLESRRPSTDIARRKLAVDPVSEPVAPSETEAQELLDLQMLLTELDSMPLGSIIALPPINQN